MSEPYTDKRLALVFEMLNVRAGRTTTFTVHPDGTITRTPTTPTGLPRVVIAGVSLGGCVEAHGTTRQGAMRRSAHAHSAPITKDPHHGWLCFKSSKPEKLITPSGLPTKLLAHEWAHIATREGHTKKWRALMKTLGHNGEAARYAARVAAHARATGNTSGQTRPRRAANPPTKFKARSPVASAPAARSTNT